MPSASWPSSKVSEARAYSRGPRARSAGPAAASGLWDREAHPVRVHRLRVGAAACAQVEGVDPRQLLRAQLEIEDVDVLSDAPRVDRLRDRRAALLEVLAQHDLRGALAHLCREALEDGVVHDGAAPIAPSRIERDPTDG